MSYDTAYQYVRTKLESIPEIKSVTNGLIPFVEVATPLAMIASAGQRSARAAQIVTVWWLFEVRLAVPINGETVQDAADAETALRGVTQVVPAAFRRVPHITIGDIVSGGANGYQDNNGQAFRVATMPVEVREQDVYGGAL